MPSPRVVPTGLYCSGLIPLRLDAVVGVVEQIKRQRLKLQFFALPDHKTAGQPNIDPLWPRAVDRMQANSRRRDSAINVPAVAAVVRVKAVSLLAPTAT